MPSKTIAFPEKLAFARKTIEFPKKHEFAYKMCFTLMDVNGTYDESYDVNLHLASSSSVVHQTDEQREFIFK